MCIFKPYIPAYFLIHGYAPVCLCIERFSHIPFFLQMVVVYNFVVIYPRKNSLGLCGDFVCIAVREHHFACLSCFVDQGGEVTKNFILRCLLSLIDRILYLRRPWPLKIYCNRSFKIINQLCVKYH